jgi:hypothetical protein
VFSALNEVAFRPGESVICRKARKAAGLKSLLGSDEKVPHKPDPAGIDVSCAAEIPSGTESGTVIGIAKIMVSGPTTAESLPAPVESFITRIKEHFRR